MRIRTLNRLCGQCFILIRFQRCRRRKRKEIQQDKYACSTLSVGIVICCCLLPSAKKKHTHTHAVFMAHNENSSLNRSSHALGVKCDSLSICEQEIYVYAQAHYKYISIEMLICQHYQTENQ